MSSIMRLTEIAADGVVQAMRLAADELRLSSRPQPRSWHGRVPKRATAFHGIRAGPA